MNKIIAAVSFDSVALAAVAMASTLTIGEAYMRTSLVDADSAKEARYPPLSSFITEAHVRELEEKNLVVIHNVLSVETLKHARENIEKLSDAMDITMGHGTNHLNECDVRQDQILSIRESDHSEQGIHGDALIHCVKLLRGIPFLLNKFHYITSHSYLVPK